MGLFLFGKQSTKSKGKPKRTWASAKQPKPWEPGKTWRMVRAVGAVVILLCVAAGSYYGQTALKQRISTQQAAPVTVVLHDVPLWLGDARADELRSAVAEVIDPDPLNRASLDNAVTVAADNAWVAQVKRIERGYDGRIDVYVAYRQPVALIGAKDGFHLVDAEARRLPGVYPYEQLESLGLPAIVHVASAPPETGKVWPGADVQAGLDLAQLMMRTPWADQVRLVDVKNYAGRFDRKTAHLSILTPDGAVRWGRPPGEEGIYEPPATEKLAMIQRVAESYRGSISGGAGKELRVYLDMWTIHSLDAVRYTAMP